MREWKFGYKIVSEPVGAPPGGVVFLSYASRWPQEPGFRPAAQYRLLHETWRKQGAGPLACVDTLEDATSRMHGPLRIYHHIFTCLYRPSDDACLWFAEAVDHKKKPARTQFADAVILLHEVPRSAWPEGRRGVDV